MAAALRRLGYRVTSIPLGLDLGRLRSLRALAPAVVVNLVEALQGEGRLIHLAAEVLDTFVYYFSIATGNYGYGAAAGLFKAAVGLVLILAANRFAHMLGERGIYSKS